MIIFPKMIFLKSKNGYLVFLFVLYANRVVVVVAHKVGIVCNAEVIIILGLLYPNLSDSSGSLF